MFAVLLLFTTDTIALLNVLKPFSAHACECFHLKNSSLGFAFSSFPFSFCFEKVWGSGGSRWWKGLHRYLFVQTTACHAIANRIQSPEFDGNI